MTGPDRSGHLTGYCHDDKILAMARQPSRTVEGEAATAVVLRTFRANGVFVAAGDLIAAVEGLTSARWQALGAAALAERPLTVPQIARRMGLTRQSVQATVNQLQREGLAEAGENPDHRRSPLIRLTRLGGERYAALHRHQVAWVNDLAAGLRVDELETTARVLQELINRLDRRPAAVQGGVDREAS